MKAHNPGHITLNNRKLKVQRWQQLPGRIEFTAVTHGDQSGNELKDQLTAEVLTLEIEETPSVTVRPELTRHSVVGSGPTAVHRIQATLWLVAPDAVEESLEDQVQRMQREIRQLWAEIAELKAERTPAPRPKPSGLRQSLQAGTTMIEADIDMSEIDDSRTD